MLEDSTNGMTAAAAAGCRVVGLPAPGTVVPSGAVAVAELRTDGRDDLDGLDLEVLYGFWAALG